MNSSIALRLLWKEYRVQRGLWLSMAFGCFALQALIAYLVPSEQESFQGILPVAFLLTGFYAIGSGAITFAIEREDGTQLRPVMLGCPPGLTLTIKTIFGVVTTAVLLALTLSSGMLMTLGSLTLPENSLHPEAQKMIIPLTLMFVALPYLGCLLWSTFFSLLTRKVIVALGLAAVAMIGSYIAVAITSIAIIESGQRQYPRQLNPQELVLAALVPCFLALLLLALNYLLTHRWLTRAFFDQTSSKSPSFFKRWRIRRSGLDGGMVVEIGVEDRTAFEVVSAEVAVHQPPPRFGLSLLYALWGPNLWRHLRFLRWKEAIETRKIYLGFLSATMLLTIWVVGENLYHTGWHGGVGFFIHAACVACGAMAFRAEQDERKVQRLADMGLRPATVWFSKHLVWFLRAVISVFTILLCTLVVVELFGNSRSAGSFETFTQGVWLNAQLPNTMPNYNPELRLAGRAIILTLTMYGVGQVCSQLIRSTIVSMFVAFVLGLVAFGWAGVCYWFNVPFIISVMPLGIGCLLVTWSRTDSWMKDDNRPRVWTWPAASLAASLALIYVGTGLFRVYEIPWSKPFFSDGTSADFNDGLTDEQRASVVAPVTDEERDTFQLYQRAYELTGKNNFSLYEDEETADEIWDTLSEDDQQAAVEAIQLALQASKRPTCARYSPVDTDVASRAASRDHVPLWNSIKLIVFDAERKTGQGRLREALENYRSSLAVSRHGAGRAGELAYWDVIIGTYETLAGLRRWAAHPECSQELIDEAFRMIDEHRRRIIPIEVANYSNALMVRNTLDADMFTLTELIGDSQQRLPLLLATKFPGENGRSHRLLNALEAADVEHMAAFRKQQAEAESGVGPGMADWYWQARDWDWQYFMTESTPLLAFIADTHAIDRYCRDEIRMDCDIRAAKIVMQLLELQRSSDELPDTLEDFDSSLNDPWTNKPFTWFPKGLPGNVINGSSVVVEANTAFLISTRSRQVKFRPTVCRHEESSQTNTENYSYPIIPNETKTADELVNENFDKLTDDMVCVEFHAESSPHVPASYIQVWKISKKSAE